jgi:plasmid stabilization system protein ParE
VSRYVLTTPAKKDIREIVFGVEDRFGRAVAIRVFESIRETLEMLAEHPGMGRPRPERWPERYRFFPHGPSLIAYRADVRPIRIIRIARAARDWSRIEPHE